MLDGFVATKVLRTGVFTWVVKGLLGFEIDLGFDQKLDEELVWVL